MKSETRLLEKKLKEASRDAEQLYRNINMPTVVPQSNPETDRHVTLTEGRYFRSVKIALQRRIGVNPLDIEAIADELNFAKRTLQRNLRREGVLFSGIRDRVRRHHAYEVLTSIKISIADISGTLDFSDRNSFTKAFKRWRGTPSSEYRRCHGALSTDPVCRARPDAIPA